MFRGGSYYLHLGKITSMNSGLRYYLAVALYGIYLFDFWELPYYSHVSAMDVLAIEVNCG